MAARNVTGPTSVDLGPVLFAGLVIGRYLLGAYPSFDSLDAIQQFWRKKGRP